MSHLQPLIAFIWCHSAMKIPPRADDVPIKGGTAPWIMEAPCSQALRATAPASVRSGVLADALAARRTAWGRRGRVEHLLLLEAISGLLKVSGVQVAISSLPYPAQFPQTSRVKTWFHRQLFESEVKSLAALTSLLTVNGFNASLRGHLDPGAEHCLHGAPCVGPGLRGSLRPPDLRPGPQRHPEA